MIVLLLAIVFIAFLVQSTVGFGAIILALSMAALIYPIEEVLPPIIALDTLQCLYIAVRYRDGIDKRLLFRRIIPQAGIGLPIGMLLFHVGNSPSLKIGFGLLVILLASLELYKLKWGNEVERPLKPSLSFGFLLGGGITHGMYGCGGPMVVYASSRMIDDKYVFRSTLHALWVVMDLILLVGFLFRGQFDGEAAELTILLLGALVVGVVAGVKVHARVNATLFRLCVYTMLLVAGTLLVVTA